MFRAIDNEWIELNIELDFGLLSAVKIWWGRDVLLGSFLRHFSDVMCFFSFVVSDVQKELINQPYLNKRI